MKARKETGSGRLTNLEAFRPLGNAAVEALLSCGTTRQLQDGEVIFRIGEADKDLLYIVSSGQIALTDADGAVTTYDATTLLGLSSYFDNRPYTLTATAVGSCEVIAVPYPAVRELEQQHPPLADALSHIIADRIRAGSGRPRGTASGALSLPARSAMNTPLTCSSGAATLSAAFQLMDARRIGSLGITDDAGGLIGLATLKSIARAVLVEGHAPEAALREAAEPVVEIPAEAPLWQAEEIQRRHGVKYLVVTEGNTPVGMLSQTNILNVLGTQQTLMRKRVERAADIPSLRALVDTVANVARDARENSRDATRAVYLLSEYHLQLQRRCVQLVLEELKAEGLGGPPRAYALVVMGSLARRESLLNPDQDNAIIIADAPPGESASLPLSEQEQAWFATFTDRLNRRLDQIGYEWCKGDIMARNPDYQRRLEEWRKQIRHMTRHPNPKAARWSNIFLDFDLLYGDAVLVDTLWQAVTQELAQGDKLLRFLAADDAEGQPALGLFNRLITSDREDGKGRVDVKRNGLRIIANGARIYALSAGVRETNTVARLKALRRVGALTADKVDSVIAAQDTLLELLLAQQISQRLAGQSPDKYVDPSALDEMQLHALVSSMRAIKRFQDRVQGVFGL